MRETPVLTRPAVRRLPMHPLRDAQVHGQLGLAICRVVTDLTLDFAFPPVLDSQPRCRGAARL